MTSQMINSTRAYEKLDTTLSKEDISMLLDFKEKPITEFLESLSISLHLQNVLFYAIGSFEQN